LEKKPNPGLSPTSGSSASSLSGASQSLSAASFSSGFNPVGSVPSSAAAAGDRSRIDPYELAIVLSHFDIGRIEAVREFQRGSRRSPKLLIRSEKSMYLLKRRARGKDDPFKVSFSHGLQLYLASKQFPLPHLMRTKGDGQSMLHYHDAIYELFEYIKGSGYDNSLEATASAGRSLALFHKLLTDYQADYEPPTGSYHGSRMVGKSFEHIPHTLEKVDPQGVKTQGDRVSQVIAFVRSSYNEAALRVNEMGLTDWPMQIVHADWHPGNMLFRGSRVVAVIDYDSARFQQRVLDVANGALQFSILGGGDDPAQWPDYIDLSRFKRFLRGYDSVPGCILTKAELRAVPWLMVEALIAESVIPIAMTGSFARLDGIGFLLMIERKLRWLQQHTAELSTAADS
jgi:Ser/Thr protein kinase RdoA (MazF antagonist)